MGAIDRFFSAGSVLPTMPEVARRLIDSFEDEKSTCARSSIWPSRTNRWPPRS